MITEPATVRRMSAGLRLRGSARIGSIAVLLCAALSTPGCDTRDIDRGEIRAHGEQPEGAPAATPEEALKEAQAVVRSDGAVEIYDRRAILRVQILDPQVRFLDSGGPAQGTDGWSKPHPQLRVTLGGLSDWMTRKTHDQRIQARLAQTGRAEPLSSMVAIVEASVRAEVQLAALEGQLAALWADTSMPASARRRVLFERWDECEEDQDRGAVVVVARAADGADAIRIRSGEWARAMIEAFIRTTLPAGSGSGYSEDELTRLNRRRMSRRLFAPYRRLEQPS